MGLFFQLSPLNVCTKSNTLIQHCKRFMKMGAVFDSTNLTNLSLMKRKIVYLRPKLKILKSNDNDKKLH